MASRSKNCFERLFSHTRQGTRRLDEAVFAAYGWPTDLTDDEILIKLLEPNLARAPGRSPLSTVGVTLASAVAARGRMIARIDQMISSERRRLFGAPKRIAEGVSYERLHANSHFFRRYAGKLHGIRRSAIRRPRTQGGGRRANHRRNNDREPDYDKATARSRNYPDVRGGRRMEKHHAGPLEKPFRHSHAIYVLRSLNRPAWRGSVIGHCPYATVRERWPLALVAVLACRLRLRRPGGRLASRARRRFGMQPNQSCRRQRHPQREQSLQG